MILIFILVGFLVYGNMLPNQFVDDDTQLNINPAFHSITNIPKFFTHGDTGFLGGGYYRPVADAFFTLEYAIFGNQPTGYHVVQLGLHILTSLLLFRLFKRFFSKEVSLILGLIFLVHPLNTESVAYISAFRENLFLLFGLLALNSNNRIIKMLWLMASILTKETGIIFLFLSPLFDYLNDRNSLVKNIFSNFGLLAIYGLMRASSGVKIVKNAVVPIQNMNLWQRVSHIPLIVFYYLKNLIYPAGLISNQAWTISRLSLADFYLPLIVIVLVFVCLGFCLNLIFKKTEVKKPVIFFGVWFGLALGIHMQIVALDVTVADRWFYAPMAGLLGLLGVFLTGYKKIFVVPVIIILIYLSGWTVARNDKWQNGLKLLANDYRISTRADYLLEKRYGTELLKNDQLDAAASHLKRANEIFPKNFGAWNNLANIYIKTGKIDEAMRAYEQSIKNDNYYGAYENLAYLLIKYKDIPEAKKFITNALSIYPGDATLWYYLLIVELKLNNEKDALFAAAKYYQLKPDNQNYTIYSRLLHGQPVSISLN